MIIERKMKFQGVLGQQDLVALFDSGATRSCIRPDFAQKIAPLQTFPNPLRIETASEGHFIEIKDRVLLDFYMDDYWFSDDFLVVPGLSEEAIIGAYTMQKWHFKLDFEHDTVVIDPRVKRMRL